MFRSGVKYIMRTDIMFEKQGGQDVRQEDEDAFLIMQEAERLEVGMA